MRKMYDSVTSADIPGDSDLVAGYIDGQYAWSESDWQKHEGKVLVKISVAAAPSGCQVYDVEQGNAGIDAVITAVKANREAGGDPTVYCSQSDWWPFIQAFQAAGVAEPHWWIANWNGQENIPAGAVAHQYVSDSTGSPGHYDISVVADTWPGVDNTPAPQPQPQPTPTPEPSKVWVYTIEKGDTLFDIAAKYLGDGNKWPEIYDLNKDKISNPDQIYPGEQITIPGEPPHQYPVPEITDSPVSGKRYRVKSGDTLWAIATAAYGNGEDYKRIAEANHIANPNLINVGEVLSIP